MVQPVNRLSFGVLEKEKTRKRRPTGRGNWGQGGGKERGSCVVVHRIILKACL